MFVVVPSGDGQFVSQATQVVSVSTVTSEGVFNVHTLSGHIVVNDVAATHFTTESSWEGSSRRLASYWYRALDLASAVLGAEDASAVSTA